MARSARRARADPGLHPCPGSAPRSLLPWATDSSPAQPDETPDCMNGRPRGRRSYREVGLLLPVSERAEQKPLDRGRVPTNHGCARGLGWTPTGALLLESHPDTVGRVRFAHQNHEHIGLGPVIPTHACETSVTIFLRVAAGRPARMTPTTTERFEAWPSLNSLPLSASLNTTVTIDPEAPVVPLWMRVISPAMFSRCEVVDQALRADALTKRHRLPPL